MPASTVHALHAPDRRTPMDDSTIGPVVERRRGERRLLAVATASPLLVLWAALSVMLGGPLAAAGAIAAIGAAALPGVALWTWLRPTADRLEAAAAGIAFGIPVLTAVFIALDRLEVRSGWAVCFTGAALGLVLLRAIQNRRRRVRPKARRRITPATWFGLAAMLALAAVMFIPPVLSAGAARADGSVGFVKNFGFDFMRHLANTVSTAQGPLPPRNLFLDGRHVDSYWLYYPGPALIVRALGTSVEAGRALLSYNFILLALLLGLLTSRLRKGWGGAFAAGSGVALFFAASSLRGVAQLIPALDRLLESENRFVFTVPLFFAIFMGHHLLAALLVLLTMDLYRPGASSAPRAAGAGAVAAGILLPVAGVISPFVGAVAIGWFILVTLWALLARRGAKRVRAARHAALAILPGILGLAGYVALFGSGFDPSSVRNMTITWTPSISGLLPNLLLCLATLIPLAALGASRRRLSSLSGASAAALVISSLLVMTMIVVKASEVDATEHEVATKAGLTLVIGMTFFASAGMSALRAGARLRPAVRLSAAGLVAVLAAGGLATSAAYVRTYSDLDSARTISAGDAEACLWMREHLPPDAKIFVATSTDYGPKNYTFVAPLAERQVMRGTKGISFFETTFVRETIRLYHGDQSGLRKWISRDSENEFYVYAGGAERLLNPDVFAALDSMPKLLEPVWQGDGVRIYRVRRENGTGRMLDRPHGASNSQAAPSPREESK